MMVALTGLLAEHYGVPMGEYETAQLACAIEREDLGITGGMQDMYAATFGGFNFIEFTDRVIVNPLRIRDGDRLRARTEPAAVLHGHHAGLRPSDRGPNAPRHNGFADDTLAGLRAQKELAVAMKAALLTGKLNDFGALLGEAWTQKKRMSPYITNERIDELYDLALRNGALGGKITGAGGGGYILLFCDFAKKHRLIESPRVGWGRHHRIRFREQGIDHMAGMSSVGCRHPQRRIGPGTIGGHHRGQAADAVGRHSPAQTVEIARLMISVAALRRKGDLLRQRRIRAGRGTSGRRADGPLCF